MSISDLIVVMNHGVVQQIGKPQDVYDHPANLFVAKFLGTPPINVFSGEVKNQKLLLDHIPILDVPGIADQPVWAAIRPEGFVLSKDGPLSCHLNGVEVMGGISAWFLPIPPVPLLPSVLLLPQKVR